MKKLKIDTQIVLQPRTEVGGKILQPKYLFVSKRGDVMKVGISSRADASPSLIDFTIAGVRRLEDTLRQVRSLDRDVDMGILPRRKNGNCPRRRNRRKAK